MSGVSRATIKDHSITILAIKIVALSGQTVCAPDVPFSREEQLRNRQYL